MRELSDLPAKKLFKKSPGATVIQSNTNMDIMEIPSFLNSTNAPAN